MRARCVDGPYAGQTFEFPYPNIHWANYEYPIKKDSILKASPVDDSELPVCSLLWIINGTDRHAYSLVENSHHGGWRLIYRDTF